MGKGKGKAHKSPPKHGANYCARSQQRRLAEQQIVQMWTAQLMADAVADVLNADFGFGAARLEKLNDLLSAKFTEYSAAIQRDQHQAGAVDAKAMVYAEDIRAKIDQRQREIFGPDCMTWAERYVFWEEK